MGAVRIVVALLVVLAFAVLFVRVLVPLVRRALGQPAGGTGARGAVVPGEVVPDPALAGFPIAFRHGYDPDDVEALFEQVYSLAATPSGRTEALAAVRSARFHLARRGGYEPVFVDDRVEALVDALANGRELPPRPGLR